MAEKGQDGFLDYDADQLKSVVTSLQDLANEAHLSPQSLAIGYVLNHPAVSSLALGASRPEQVLDNVRAYEAAQLSEDLIKS